MANKKGLGDIYLGLTYVLQGFKWLSKFMQLFMTALFASLFMMLMLLYFATGSSTGVVWGTSVLGVIAERRSVATEAFWRLKS